MAKKRKKDSVAIHKTDDTPVKNIENKPPQQIWQNFEHCWHTCVKNSKPIHLESCWAHIKSLGLENKQDKWIDAIIQFGVKIEK